MLDTRNANGRNEKRRKRGHPILDRDDSPAEGRSSRTRDLSRAREGPARKVDQIHCSKRETTGGGNSCTGILANSSCLCLDDDDPEETYPFLCHSFRSFSRTIFA